MYYRNRRMKYSSYARLKRREREKARKVIPKSDAEIEALRREQDQEWRARLERQRTENERRWEEREKKEGRMLSKEEHRARDSEEEKQKPARKPNRLMTSFFRPVGSGSENVDCNAGNSPSEALPAVLEKDVNKEGDRMGDQGACVDTTEPAGSAASTFKPGMKVFLRLAFIDSEQLDRMVLKDSKNIIKQKGIIGKVTIEDMVEKDVARLDLVEFVKLGDYSKRDAGKDVESTLFSQLKNALHKVEGRVNTKYLTKQNRQFGENHKWTEKQVERIRNVVEEAKAKWPTAYFSKAAELLRTRYNGPRFGKISATQVRNVYVSKVEKSNEPKAPVGRPRKLPVQ